MNKWVRPIRTGIAVFVGLIPVVPVLIPALGLDATVGVGASLVTVASLISRILLIPQVDQALSKLGISTLHGK